MKKAVENFLGNTNTSFPKGKQLLANNGREYGLVPKNKFYRIEPSPEEITSRERDVLRLIVDEYTTEEIAGLLHLSKRTVGTHRQNLLTKIGARNTVGLVKYALRHGIVN